MHEQEYYKYMYHTRMKWQKDWTYIRAYTLPHPSPPPSQEKKPLSYPIQMEPTNIKQYCQPIFIRDDSISIKWCVTDFFFRVFLIINTRFV